MTSIVPTTNLRHLGIILASFDPDMAGKRDFDTPAFVVQIPHLKEVKAFLARCTQCRDAGLWKRAFDRCGLRALIDPWPPLLHTTYMSLARVKAASGHRDKRGQVCRPTHADPTLNTESYDIRSGESIEPGSASGSHPYEELRTAVSQSLQDYASETLSEESHGLLSPLIHTATSLSQRTGRASGPTCADPWDDLHRHSSVEAIEGAYCGDLNRIVVG